MIYEFRFRNESGDWEDVGRGRGSGDNAPGDAFSALRDEPGGLPFGDFQYRPVQQPEGATEVIGDISISQDWKPLNHAPTGFITY